MGKTRFGETQVVAILKEAAKVGEDRKPTASISTTFLVGTTGHAKRVCTGNADPSSVSTRAFRLRMPGYIAQPNYYPVLLVWLQQRWRGMAVTMGEIEQARRWPWLHHRPGCTSSNRMATTATGRLVLSVSSTVSVPRISIGHPTGRW